MLVSLAGAAWTQWERWRQDPWLRLLHGTMRKLKQAGITVEAHAARRQLASALHQHGATRGGTTDKDVLQIHDWLLRLEAWRYAPSTQDARASRAALSTLQKQYRQLHWPQRTIQRT